MTTSGTACILYPDIGASATLSLTAGTTASGYALTDMQDGDMSSTWKSATLTGANTIKIDLGSSQTVGALAILGHNLYSARNAGATYSDIVVSRSVDDVTYTVVLSSTVTTGARITSDLPWIVKVGSTARYLKIAFTDPVGARAYAPEIAELFVAGSILDLEEPTGLPWTPAELKIVSSTGGSDVGMGIPSLVGHVVHRPKVEIGEQAIDHAVFDDLVPSADYPLAYAAPSFAHFIRTCWSLGKRFVFCPWYDSADMLWAMRFDLAIQSAGPPIVYYDPPEAGEQIVGNTSGAECYAYSDATLVSGVTYDVIVRRYNGIAWTIGEVVLAAERAVPDQAFGALISFTELSGQQRQWLGATVCRATDGTAKLRTPFVSAWRRKLQLDMQSSGEWMQR